MALKQDHERDIILCVDANKRSSFIVGAILTRELPQYKIIYAAEFYSALMIICNNSRNRIAAVVSNYELPKKENSIYVLTEAERMDVPVRVLFADSYFRDLGPGHKLAIGFALERGICTKYVQAPMWYYLIEYLKTSINGAGDKLPLGY